MLSTVSSMQQDFMALQFEFQISLLPNQHQKFSDILILNPLMKPPKYIPLSISIVQLLCIHPQNFMLRFVVLEKQPKTKAAFITLTDFSNTLFMSFVSLPYVSVF